MSKIAFLLFGCGLVVLVVSVLDVSGHPQTLDVSDLEFAASEKQHKYEKGHESEHHGSDHEEKGEKGKKGYESEHGYVQHIYFIVFIALI